MNAIFRHINTLLIALLIISIVPAVSCRKSDNKNGNSEINDQIEASLKDFENRKKYTSFTAEILKKIPDDQLEIAILDYITDVKIKDNHHKEYEIIKNLSRGMQNIYITWNLENEVNNGGFIQYYYNTSGRFNGEIAEALHNIKGYKTEKIVNDAITVYNKNRTLHPMDKISKSMESFMDSNSESELDRLDDLFYKSGENLSELRIRYIRENYSEFITK